MKTRKVIYLANASGKRLNRICLKGNFVLQRMDITGLLPCRSNKTQVNKLYPFNNARSSFEIVREEIGLPFSLSTIAAFDHCTQAYLLTLRSDVTHVNDQSNGLGSISQDVSYPDGNKGRKHRLNGISYSQVLLLWDLPVLIVSHYRNTARSPALKYYVSKSYWVIRAKPAGLVDLHCATSVKITKEQTKCDDSNTNFKKP